MLRSASMSRADSARIDCQACHSTQPTRPSSSTAMISTNDNRWRRSQLSTVTSRTRKATYEISVEGRGADMQEALQAWRENGRSGSMLVAIWISSRGAMPWAWFSLWP